MRLIFIAACVLVAFIAVAGNIHNKPNKLAVVVTSTVTVPVTIPTNCQARANLSLPDPRCTPGALNASVTQKTIKTTICKVGWASTVRPPLTFTEPLKSKMMRAYGYSDSLRHYEFDHLVPIELGGAPASVKNLWPEPHDAVVNGKPVGSFVKDGIENSLRAQVCNGQMKLAKARKIMAKGTWEN